MKKTGLIISSLACLVALTGCGKNKDEPCLGIEVASGSAHQIVFASWDDFNIENLELQRITKSKKIPIVGAELGVETKDSTTNPGEEKTVTIKYEFKGETFSTSYEIYKGVSLEIDPNNNTPNKTKYLEYSTFEPDGLAVNLYSKNKEHYSNIANSDSLSWCQTSEYNKSKPATTLALGADSVTGYCKSNKSIHAEVEIDPVAEIKSIEIDEENSSAKTSYKDGDSFSFSGLKINGKGEDESYGVVSVPWTSFDAYDAKSVDDNPNDKTKWEKTFNESTTAVKIFLKNHENVEPIVLAIDITAASIGKGDQGLSLELIDDLNKLNNDDQVLIISTAKNLVLNLMNKDDGYRTLIKNDFDYNASTIAIDSSFSEVLLNTTVNSGSNTSYTFEMTPGQKTLTLTVGSSGVVTTKKGEHSNMYISLDEDNVATIKGNYTDSKGATTEKYLNISTSNKFTFNTKSEGALKIYKVK